MTKKPLVKSELDMKKWEVEILRTKIMKLEMEIERLIELKGGKN